MDNGIDRLGNDPRIAEGIRRVPRPRRDGERKERAFEEQLEGSGGADVADPGPGEHQDRAAAELHVGDDEGIGQGIDVTG